MSIDNIADLVSRVQYTATPLQEEFAYPFPIFQDADLVVDLNGVTQTLVDDYTVSGAGDDTGGYVTFTEPRIAGEIVTIYRSTLIERTSDFPQNGPWFSAATNDELDRLTIIAQEQRQALRRSIRFPMNATETDNGAELSPVDAWRQRYLYISEDGQLEPAAAVALTTLSQSVIGALLFNITPREEAADLTTTDMDLWYPEGDARRYRMTGDDFTNNNAALANLRAVAAQGVKCFIPAGIYRYSTSPNWNIPFLHLSGERGTILKHTGSGIMFNIDGGAEGGPGLTYGIRVEDLIFSGNANSTVGVYSRGAVHCMLRNVQVRDCTEKGFWIRHGVSNIYDNCVISTNDQTLNFWPDYGFYLDNNGVGYYTADCTFINCVAEGFGDGTPFEGTGCYLADASGNTFLGGTFEAVDTGLIISATSDHNKFDSVWMEANETNDIIDNGKLNMFVNVLCSSATSGNSVEIRGQGAVIQGGFMVHIHLDTGSVNTTILGTAVSSSGSGVSGPGTYRQLGVTRVDGDLAFVSKSYDVLGDRGSFTGTLTGVDSVVQATVRYAVNGNDILLELPAGLTGTSNSTAATITGMPAAIRPAFAQRLGGWVVNSGGILWGEISIGTDGVITLSNGAGGTAFTNSGTKGATSNSLRYRGD